MVSSEVDRVNCVVNDEVQNTPEIIIIIDLYNVKRTGCDNFIFLRWFCRQCKYDRGDC